MQSRLPILAHPRTKWLTLGRPNNVLCWHKKCSQYHSSGHQKLSEKPSVRCVPTHFFIPSRQRPLVVEHVNGRERQLSWSPRSGLLKTWKEVDNIEEGSGEMEENTRITTSSVSVITGRISSWFRQMFLPTNYPHSVHRS